MSTVGLTKAMREALEKWPCRSAAMRWRLHDAGLVDLFGTRWGITPRGHAALAAPRMTQAEYDMLENAEQSNCRGPFKAAHSAVRWRLVDRLWLRCVGGAYSDTLTPAGRTALNNVRAAMGSPDCKEDV